MNNYPPFSRTQAIFCFTVAAGIDILMGLRQLPEVLAGGFHNPDSYMRILRLEETLRTGHLAYLVPRDGSGAGTLLHWSHFLDAILMLLATPLLPFLGMRTALHAAGVVLGPLVTGMLGAALAWAAAPLSMPGRRWLAAVMSSIAVPITGYGIPGVVHHHIPVALAVVLASGFAYRAIETGRRDGIRLGLAGAAGILLTPEAMPFLLMGFGGLGLGWIIRPDSERPAAGLRAAGVTFLLVLLIAYAIDPPYAGYGATAIDRLSVTWIAFAFACTVICLALARIDRAVAQPAARAIVGAVLVLACLGGWIAAFPSVAQGPGGLMPPDVADAFFSGIAEMQPIKTWLDACIFLTPGILGLATALWLWRVRPGVGAPYVALCALVTIVLAALHLRFSTYPALVGAAMLPVALTLAGDHVATRLACLVGFLLVPSAASTLSGFVDPPVPPGRNSCSVREAAAMLAPYAGQIVLTDPNEVPELLYETGVLTVGSLYHRNAAAFVRLRNAWRSAPGRTEPAPVRVTGARYVMVCPKPGRSLMVKDLPPSTLLDALNADNPPPWLIRVAESKASGHVLYRIRDQADTRSD